MLRAIQGIDIVPAGAGERLIPPLDLLDRLSAAIARGLGVSCRVGRDALDVAFAEDALRRQHYSTAILAAMPLPPAGRLTLAVTEADLYVPVLTFVYGEAQLAGPRAIVSLHRLSERFYGQPEDQAKLLERLEKEALHELGHTLGLRHCDNWRCVMASSHSVERLDLKEPRFCPNCAGRLRG